MTSEDKVLEWLDLAGGQTVLDLGCGTGKFLSRIRQKIGRNGYLAGVDRAPELINSASSNPEAAAELFVQDIDGASLAFPDGRFDRILCHNVIECIVEKPALISECHRCLRPGGKLVLSHHDFDTAVYNSSHKDLTRDIVHCFSDTTQKWQKVSDGQIGRKLGGLIAESPFTHFKRMTHVLTEYDYAPGAYGFAYSQWAVAIAGQDSRFEQSRLDAWQKDLCELSTKGAYYFSINLMAVVAHK